MYLLCLLSHMSVESGSSAEPTQLTDLARLASPSPRDAVGTPSTGIAVRNNTTPVFLHAVGDRNSGTASTGGHLPCLLFGHKV